MLKLTEKTVADFFYVSLISQAGNRLSGLVVKYLPHMREIGVRFPVGTDR